MVSGSKTVSATISPEIASRAVVGHQPPPVSDSSPYTIEPPGRGLACGTERGSACPADPLTASCATTAKSRTTSDDARRHLYLRDTTRFMQVPPPRWSPSPERTRPPSSVVSDL